MKKSSFLLISLGVGAGLVVGLISGSFIFRNPTPAPVIVRETNAKFQSILDHEYADYTRLKNLEERYSKADEILGKIMNIFLADLQLHFVTPKDEVVVAEQKKSPAPVGSVTEPTSIAALQKKSGEVINLENLHDRAQVEDFLSSHKKTDLRPEWSAGEPIKNLPLTLNGCYEGRAEVVDPIENWNVSMYYQIDSENKGKAMTVISTKGKVFSRGRSRGNLNNFRGIPNDPQSVLMEVDPDNIFQMYFLPNQEQWIANIYAKQKNDSYKYKGKLILHHGNGCEQP